MKKGFYTARYLDRQGKEVQRDYYLPDAHAVRSEISNLGGTVLSVEPSIGFFVLARVDREYRIRFLESLKFYMSVGYSPGAALELLIEHETDSKVRTLLEPGREVLARGGSFGDAFANLSLFDQSVTAMMRAGEQVGMNESIDAAVDYLQNRQVIWKKVVATASLLSTEIVTAVSAVYGIYFQVLPWIERNTPKTEDAEFLEKFHASIEQAYLVSGVLFWGTAGACLALVLMVAGYFAGAESLRRKLEDLLTRVPMLNRVITHGAMADGFYVTGRMLLGGVTCTEAVRTAREAAIVPHVKRYWVRAEERLLAGVSPGKSLQDKLLSRAERTILEAHQDGRQLGAILISLAQSRRDSASAGMRQLLRFGLFVTLGYLAATGAIGLWIYTIQDSGLQKSMSYMGGMGF